MLLETGYTAASSTSSRAARGSERDGVVRLALGAKGLGVGWLAFRHVGRVAGLGIVIGLAASYLPAWVAVSIDPLRSLNVQCLNSTVREDGLEPGRADRPFGRSGQPRES